MRGIPGQFIQSFNQLESICLQIREMEAPNDSLNMSKFRLI